MWCDKTNSGGTRLREREKDDSQPCYEPGNWSALEKFLFVVFPDFISMETHVLPRSIITST